MRHRSFTPLAALALFALPTLAQAQIATLNFDDVQGTPILPGTVINTVYQPVYGVTFMGLTNFSLQVQVIDGIAPTNVLDATPGTVEVDFKQAVSSVRFDVVADPAGYGQSSTPVLFFDNMGNQIASLDIDQTTNGHYDVAQGNVARILLPGDAYYDNLSFVPEPGTMAMLAAGVVGAAGLRLTRKRRK